MTYSAFFVLGIVLYASAPRSRRTSAASRCSCCAFCVILSMYGGGFATVPAYLADMFGTQMVGAIHGRLLTAWSAAGILGPVHRELHARVPARRRRAARRRCTTCTHVHPGRPAGGRLHLQLLVRPVESIVPHDRTANSAPNGLAHERRERRRPAMPTPAATAAACGLVGMLAWLAVGIPLPGGVWIALRESGGAVQMTSNGTQYGLKLQGGDGRRRLRKSAAASAGHFARNRIPLRDVRRHQGDHRRARSCPARCCRCCTRSRTRSATCRRCGAADRRWPEPVARRSAWRDQLLPRISAAAGRPACGAAMPRGSLSVAAARARSKQHAKQRWASIFTRPRRMARSRSKPVYCLGQLCLRAGDAWSTTNCMRA